MNYLQIVNKVLRRLRQNEVTSVNQTTYSKLVGQLVNTTKSEVEKSWKWQHLRASARVDCSPNIFRYSVDTQQGFSILEVVNQTTQSYVEPVTSQQMTEWLLLQTPQTGDVSYYNFNGYDNNGNPRVDLYPIPNSGQVLHFNMVAPQDELSADSDTPYVPWELLYLGAYARAVEERGEDGATSAASAWNEYRTRMADFIALEATNSMDEITWEAV